MCKYLKTLKYGDIPISFDSDYSNYNLLGYIDSNCNDLIFEIRLNTKGSIITFPCVVKYDRYIKRLTPKEFNKFYQI